MVLCVALSIPHPHRAFFLKAVPLPIRSAAPPGAFRARAEGRAPLLPRGVPSGCLSSSLGSACMVAGWMAVGWTFDLIVHGKRQSVAFRVIHTPDLLGF